MVFSFSVTAEFRARPLHRISSARGLSSADQPSAPTPPSSASASAPARIKAPLDPIIERARERAGVPVAEAAPKLYDDGVLLDMQRVLVALERRVKEGPASLAPEDVEELSTAVSRILDEMKSDATNAAFSTTIARPLSSQPSSTSAESQQQSRASSLPRPDSNPSGDLLHAEPEIISALQAAAASSTAPGAAPTSSKQPLDESDDEGPAYTGQGGMGQPRGTVNTYVIPGMEEMTAEEYRQTLQQSIIDRQRRRRASGIVGNLSSTSYLDGL
jgi:hypothetical protein